MAIMVVGKPGVSTRLFSRIDDYFLGVLAPRGFTLPEVFVNPSPTPELYEDMLAEIQRLRGRVYLHDGAISQSNLDATGRYLSPVDEHSWQLFFLNDQIRPVACIRATPHEGPIGLADLHLSRLLAHMDNGTAATYRRALEAFLEQNQQEGLGCGEIGGWAVAEEFRKGAKGTTLAIACWALGRLLRPYRGLATATQRNGSAPLLRRLGGFRLRWQGKELLPYFDPVYKCDMELIEFDSRHPAPAYEATIQQLSNFLARALIVVHR